MDAARQSPYGEHMDRYCYTQHLLVTGSVSSKHVPGFKPCGLRP